MMYIDSLLEGVNPFGNVDETAGIIIANVRSTGYSDDPHLRNCVATILNYSRKEAFNNGFRVSKMEYERALAAQDAHVKEREKVARRYIRKGLKSQFDTGFGVGFTACVMGLVGSAGAAFIGIRIMEVVGTWGSVVQIGVAILTILLMGFGVVLGRGALSSLSNLRNPLSSKKKRG